MSFAQNVLDNWSLAANIATVIATVATAVALVFLGLQIRGESKARKRDGVIRLFDILDTPESKENRKIVYLAYAEKSDFGEKEKKAAESEIANLDQIALMVRENYIPKRIALKMFSFSFVKFWEASKSYIEKQRELRHSPKWVENLELFYNQCKAYRDKEYPNEIIHFFKIDDKNSVHHYVET
jgi:hypothetical protein